jgi:UDP-N-acetylglucosamine 2-epimerase (non-hydrolysing)
MKRKHKIVLIAGARPNFMKIAPLINELDRIPSFKNILIHTGQHYDYSMSELFFRDLGLRKPDVYLGVGSGTHAEQTARIMIALEKELIKIKPDLVIVVGDVNSTLAAAIVCSKLCIRLAHVEAGLRSFDMTMPEEVNRIVTDRLSDLLFTISADSADNLIKEGVDRKKIFFTGNVMIDTLIKLKPRAEKLNAYKNYGVERKNYCLVTLHRPSNVDNRDNILKIIKALSEISLSLPVIFPVHPRTLNNIDEFGFRKYLKKPGLIATAPVGYIENLSVMMNSRFVITDSGGIQSESTFMKIPCITLRKNTELTVTEKIGTNTVIGLDTERLFVIIDDIISDNYKKGRIPKYWDGKASERIAGIIKKLFL